MVGHCRFLFFYTIMLYQLISPALALPINRPITTSAAAATARVMNADCTDVPAM